MIQRRGLVRVQHSMSMRPHLMRKMAHSSRAGVEAKPIMMIRKHRKKGESKQTLRLLVISSKSDTMTL